MPLSACWAMLSRHALLFSLHGLFRNNLSLLLCIEQLTTHSMEEADILSSRIAIMSHGLYVAVDLQRLNSIQPIVAFSLFDLCTS